MAIPWKDIEKTAKALGVEPCALSAVCEVEAGGEGFLPDGRPKILFEPHIFWQQLVKRNYNPAGLLSRADVKAAHGDISDILYQKWKTKPYGPPGAHQWARLERAKKINEEAALCSASWGAFQIMGFNYGLCDCDNVHYFVKSMGDGYEGQLEMLAEFLKANNLVRHLKTKNWAAFAKGYNGSGYAQNQYDLKMRQAYEKCARGK